MGILPKPDDMTAQALKRLRADSDFQRVTSWLERALEALDKRNRMTADGVLLRMGQGAAQATSEAVEYFSGKREGAQAISSTRDAGSGAQRAP